MANITVIGAGMVGATIAYTAMLKGLSSQIRLIDINKDRQEGEVLDLSHGMFGTETGEVTGGNYSDCSNADVIIITAGANQKPGQSRLDLATANIGIMRSIINDLKPHINPNAKVLVVSNPVDILTHIAKQELGLPANQVFGSGTYLDSARLKQTVAEQLGVSSTSVHGYMLGEHGDTGFAAWSKVGVSGTPIRHLLSQEKLDKIEYEVKGMAYHIIEKKQATYYGIGVVAIEIVESILRNQNRVIPVSTIPGDHYGINNMCVSVPSVIGANGVERVWEMQLEDAEFAKLRDCSTKLSEIYDSSRSSDSMN